MQNSENIQIEENKDFLTTQLITYIGNKRRIIGEIEKEIELISEKSAKEKLVCTDLFSGSGIVARMLKRHQKPAAAEVQFFLYSTGEFGSFRRAFISQARRSES